MRASRLLSILTTLQARGQVTAPELAEACEVSVRTIYRDIDALAASGVPVYADRGAEGGYRLLDGYRVRLNGLSQNEAEALFLTGIAGPGGGARAGCGDDRRTEQADGRPARQSSRRRRTDAGAFSPRRAGLVRRGGRTQASAHHCRRGSARDVDQDPLPELARREAAPRRAARSRAERWQLVSRRSVDGSVRTYRVARVLDCTALDDRFDRPAAFDLAGYWQDATLRLEAEMHPNVAIVRLSPFGVKLLDALSQPYVKARTQLEETADADGWRIARVPTGKTSWHAAAELLRLGSEAEVLEPADLREKMAEMTQAMAARYRAAARKA